MTEAELRAHRRAIVVERPSLPHRASKAFKHLVRELETQHELRESGVMEPAPRPYERERPVVAMPLLRPDPDLSKVAILMVQHLAEKARQERERDTG